MYPSWWHNICYVVSRGMVIRPIRVAILRLPYPTYLKITTSDAHISNAINIPLLDFWNSHTRRRHRKFQTIPHYQQGSFSILFIVATILSLIAEGVRQYFTQPHVMKPA